MQLCYYKCIYILCNKGYVIGMLLFAEEMDNKENMLSYVHINEINTDVKSRKDKISKIAFHHVDHISNIFNGQYVGSIQVRLYCSNGSKVAISSTLP